MSGEVWTFDAEVGPMLNKIRQINNEQQLLERQIKQNAETAKRGSALAQQAVEQDLMATYKLTQEKKRLFEEIKRLETQQKQASTTTTATTAGFSKNQMAIQQLAFAADDAAASFGTGGLAGAMRGAANNLSMVAMMINPVYGALTGIGLAIGGLFVKRWEDAAKAIDDSGESMKKARDASVEYQRQLMSLSESVAELSGEEEKAMNLRIEARRQEMLAKPIEEKVKADQLVSEKRQRLSQAIRLRGLDESGLAGGALDANVVQAQKELADAESRALAASGKVNKIQAMLDEEGASRRSKFEKDRSAKAGEKRLQQRQNVGRFAQGAVGKIDAGLRGQIATMLRGGSDIGAVVKAITPAIQAQLGEESFGLIPGIESLAGREASRLVGQENEKLLAMSPARRKLEQSQAETAKAQRALENARIDARADGKLSAAEKAAIRQLENFAGMLEKASNALRDQVAAEENQLPQLDRNAGL